MKSDANTRVQDDRRPHEQGGAPLVALWHAIWAVAVALTALAAQMLDGLKDAPLAALLLKLYSGRTPAEILAFDARAALDRLGLPSALTRQRANGLNSMVGRIREAALAAD